MRKCTIKQCHYYDERRWTSIGYCSGYENNCSNFENAELCKQPLIQYMDAIVLTQRQKTIFDFFKALSDVELLACDIDENITLDDLKIAKLKFEHDITETTIDNIVWDGQANTHSAICVLDKLSENEGECYDEK